MSTRSLKVVAGDQLVDISDQRIDIPAAVQEFKIAWYKTRDALFGMLDLILQYRDRAGYQRLREELEEQGIIKRSVMSMLETITNNQVLMNPAYRALLPVAYNTLWALTRLEEEELQLKIETGVVNPNLKLEEAKALRRPQAQVVVDAKTPAVEEVIMTVRMKPGLVNRHRSQLDKLVADLENLGGSVERKGPYK